MSDDSVYTGKVCWFSPKKGFGFIQWEKEGIPQTDLFLHFSDIVMKDGGFKTIDKDAKVRFKIGLNARSQPKAVDVSLED